MTREATPHLLKAIPRQEHDMTATPAELDLIRNGDLDQPAAASWLDEVQARGNERGDHLAQAVVAGVRAAARRAGELCASHLGNNPDKPRCELPAGHVGCHRHYGFGWGLTDNGREPEPALPDPDLRREAS